MLGWSLEESSAATMRRSGEQRTKRINCWSGVCVVTYSFGETDEANVQPLMKKTGMEFFDAQGKMKVCRNSLQR
ncbi:hypothetical protein P7H17_16605 [Paenibacillus larvae]|nr:hypothetical protein [Paenibacillus larvae]MDT2287329.1 hypothetical protein [Paenibacillus larvae]